jgi:hypothetical protein
MKNLKTTITGTVAAVCAGLAAQFPEYKELLSAIAVIFGTLFAYFAKDKTTTGVS